MRDIGPEKNLKTQEGMNKILCNLDLQMSVCVAGVGSSVHGGGLFYDLNFFPRPLSLPRKHMKQPLRIMPFMACKTV